jgi:hypothetical protein
MMLRHVLVGISVICTTSLIGQLKSPAEFLPHPFQKEFTPHHLLVDYFEYVAAQSASIILEDIGTTYEHRRQFLAIISTPENLANLENIRLNNLKITGMEQGGDDLALSKAIVWLGYSVHGNEAGGSEASMQVVYDLVTGKNGADTWLENTIVILEPSANPDGYSRYTNWNSQVSSLPYNASSDAWEHDEPWPGGRTNHYLFDLNRDWAWQTQVESRNRVAAYRRWMPHVVADLHEMSYSSPYYFAPAAQPYHEFITEWQRNFQVAIGKNHAKYFDQEGWAYFTKEYFDLFYPSYGDTYPVFSGAIGMTYEQGGHGFAGRAISLPNDDTLWLSDRIAHHVTTSMSTIEVTSKNSQDVISQFEQYFKRSLTNPPGSYKTYVVKGSKNPARLTALKALLDLQGIIYGSAAPAQFNNAFDYVSGKFGTASIEDGDLVISAYQPQAVLTKVLIDPESKLVDSET